VVSLDILRQRLDTPDLPTSSHPNTENQSAQTVSRKNFKNEKKIKSHLLLVRSQELGGHVREALVALNKARALGANPIVEANL
jgi:hypothetical protein